jgi:hypothetical protein
MFSPRNSRTSGGTVLVLDDRGRNAYAAEDGVYHRLARKGLTICAADIRCVGDTRPEVGRGNPGYTIPHDSEEEFAWASLILGQSLLKQRVEDILALVQAIRNEPASGRAPVKIAARGRLTVPALFAFALSPQVDSLYLADGLISYRSILETENYQQPLSNFDWKLFRATDLPEIAAQSAPRRIHIAGAVDAEGRRMETSAAKSIYSSANIIVSADPDWSETALASV